MEGTRLFALIQIVTAVAVVLGLVLVAFELRQTREFTRLQMAQDGITMGMSELTARYGENVAEVVARACADGSDLTGSDAVVMDSVFRYQMWWIGRQKQRSVRDLGGVIHWEQEGLRRLSYVAGFPQGLAWLETFTSRDPTVQAFIDQAIPDLEPTPCTEVFRVFDVDSRVATGAGDA